MNDSSRTNYIQVFKCYECGRKLRLSYEFSEHENEEDGSERGDPTGADCRYSALAIHPCRNCIEKHTGPAKMLSEAIKGLTAE